MSSFVHCNHVIFEEGGFVDPDVVDHALEPAVRGVGYVRQGKLKLGTGLDQELSPELAPFPSGYAVDEYLKLVFLGGVVCEHKMVPLSVAYA